MSDDVFSAAQLAQLETMVDKATRKAVREELADSGLRIDGDHADSAREDFRFTRKFRLFVEGIAGKIGWVIIGSFVGLIIFLINLGANAWKGQ